MSTGCSGPFRAWRRRVRRWSLRPTTTLRAASPSSTPPAARPARKDRPLTDADIALAESMVIRRDASALVLDKPPGLATQGGTKTESHVDGLLGALQGEAPVRPKLVHRLDKDTSGALLVARTPRAAAWFAKAFSNRSARKRSEEHTSELQSLMRLPYAVFCLKKKKTTTTT